MKIGIDCRMYSTKFTGIGKYTKQLVENLAKIDHKNQYLLYFNQEEFDTVKLPGANFKKYLVNANHYSLKEQTKFAAALYQTSPDIMHFTHFNSPILYLKKQITTIHDLTLHFYPGQKYKNPLQRLAYKTVFKTALIKSKAIITPTNHTAKDLHTFYKFTKNKTHTIYEAADELFLNFDPINYPKSKFQPTNNNYILYTGNWREHKNLNNLISAFEILKSHYKYNGQLVITGNPQSGTKELQQRIKSLESKNLILTPGIIPENELPYLYYKADAYVFPSYYEGFGLPVLEAFATKTPVIVSNSSCLQEIGQNGTLSFNPLDPQDIALKINQAITDPKTRDTLTCNGTQRLQDFSFKKMAEETLKLYLSI